MELGGLVQLALETMIISLCLKIMSILITVILYGRMVEIYLTVSVAPIPFATMTNREWGNIGTNYFKSLFALGFQGFFMMVCVAIYAVLVNSMTIAADIHSILVCDPESEYSPLINALHGQVVKLAANSHDYVNPLDINMNYSEDDNPLHLKSEFILSLFELILGRNGIEGEERSIIDQAIRAVYAPYLSNPCPENMPILEDLYDY